jgi:cystathionine beta-lyase
VVRNSVTFKSAAKSFNLAGMQVAYLFTNNKDVADKIKVWHRQGISTPGMVAQRAAYTEGDAWLDQLIAYNDANLTFVDEYTRKNIPLIKSVKPEGTYLGWVDVSAVMAKVGAVAKAEEATKNGTPTTPAQFMERWFVEHARVQMNPGSSFGTGGEARMRMNCASSRKMLELALSNLASATRNL